MSDTPGQRLFKIRLSYGDGVREPESLREFAIRVKRKTKRGYSAMRLSLLERMEQKWKLIDVETLSQLDKDGRGKTWLAGWDDELALRVTGVIDQLEAVPKPASAVTRRASAK